MANEVGKEVFGKAIRLMVDSPFETKVGAYIDNKRRLQGHGFLMNRIYSFGDALFTEQDCRYDRSPHDEELRDDFRSSIESIVGEGLKCVFDHKNGSSYWFNVIPSAEIDIENS